MTTSLYLRRGTVKRAEKRAKTRIISLSQYAEEALTEKLARDEAMTAERREGERRSA